MKSIASAAAPISLSYSPAKSCSIVLYMVIAFALSAGMTALVLVSGALLTFVFRGRTHAIEEQGEEVSSTNKSLYAATIEHLQSLKAAKTYGAEERNFSIFSDLSAEVVRANVDGARQQAIAATWFELGSVMILAVVLFVSIRVLAVPPASILILLLLFARVMPRIMSGQQHYRAFVNSLPSFANLLDIEARCTAAAEPAAHPHDRMSLTRELAAEDISFTYSEGRVPAVRDLSLVIPAGKVVALVGPSGAGKSTIADILMGLVHARFGDAQTRRPAARSRRRARMARSNRLRRARHVSVSRHDSREPQMGAARRERGRNARGAAAGVGVRFRRGTERRTRYRRRRSRHDGVAGRAPTPRTRARIPAPSFDADSRRGDQQPRFRKRRTRARRDRKPPRRTHRRADRASPLDHPMGRSDLRRRRRQGGRVGRLVVVERICATAASARSGKRRA